MLVVALALPAVVALPARAEEPRRVLVVAFGKGDAAQDAAAVEEVLRQAIRANPRFALESLQREDAPSPEEAFARAQQDVAAGKQAYDELETEIATERLTRAVDALLAYMDALADPALLHRALALLASVHNQSGDAEAARERFRLLATLAPAYVLSDKEHPPSDERLLLEVQEALAFAEPGRVELSVDEGSPPAAVWVDGVYRGITPLTLDDLEPGAHAYLLRREGFARAAGRFEVGRDRRVRVRLRPLAGQDALESALSSSRWDDGEDVDPGFAALARAAGEPQELLIARVEKTPASPRVRLARIAAASGRVIAAIAFQAQAEALPAEVAAAVAELLAVSVDEVEAVAVASQAAEAEADATPWVLASAAGGAVLLAAAVAAGGVAWWLAMPLEHGLPAGYDAHVAARRHVLGY